MADAFNLRPLGVADAPAMAGLFRTCADELGSRSEAGVEAMLHRLRAPGTRLVDDSRAALASGQLVGFLIFSRAEEARLWGMVGPAHRRHGIGSALMAWGVGRARAEPGLAEVFAGTDARRADALALYRDFGFLPTRSFYKMVHAAPAAIGRMAPPVGVEVRQARDEDDAVNTAVEVYNQAFVDHWDFRRVSVASVAHEVSEPGAGPSMTFFADLEGRPVAMCLCHLAAGMGFVNQLGTVPTARGRGIGGCLLNHALAMMAAAGATHVELNVDADNPTGAVRFYEGAGMTRAASYSLFELKLR